MSSNLPDISRSKVSQTLAPLDWVGMQNIDLPVTVSEDAYHRELHALVDAQVDLPLPHVKGIHMSRLHLLVDDYLGRGAALTPPTLHELLQRMIDSHQDCGSNSARLNLKFNLLVKRPALVSDGLFGWKSYPVEIDTSLIKGMFQVRANVTVEYSSTCPCSAALSRQLIEQHFLETFQAQETININQIAEWIRDNGTLATPHSQRSEAKISVDLIDQSARDMSFLPLIDCIEKAVATPVQTAVKRADEQAFASLNGQNLMFVEDAARRIEAALENFSNPEVYVRHIESLHSHDAAAWTSPNHQKDKSW